MEGKLLEARNKKETLKARAAAAYASKQLNEDVTSLVRPEKAPFISRGMKRT